MHLEPMFNACARGHLGGVQYMLERMRADAKQKAHVANPDLPQDAPPPPVYLDYVGISGLTPLLTTLTQALERATKVAQAADGVADHDADQADSTHTESAAVASALLEAGASPTNDAGTDQPPVQLALLCALQSRTSAWLEVVDQMLQLGANLNEPDAAGQTCLHHAVRLRSAEVTRALLQLGALPESTTLSGQRPVDMLEGDSSAEAAAVREVLGAFVQVKVEARLEQRTVLPREAVQDSALAEQFVRQFNLRKAPKLHVEGGDGGAGGGEVAVRMDVQYDADLAALSWPSKPYAPREPAAKVTSTRMDDDDAVDADALPGRDDSGTHKSQGFATYSGIAPGVVRAREVILGEPQFQPRPGAALRMRQVAVRALLEEVNLPQLPSRMVLIYEGVDFRTNEEWVESTYRLLFLCDHEGDTPCSDMHSGYTLEGPGDLLRSALPAFQVAASLLQLQHLTGKYKHMKVPADMPGMVDLGMSR